jgi:Autographiviridae endonuclease VII
MKKWDLEFKNRDPEGFRRYTQDRIRKCRYGVSSEWYKAQLEKQDGKCAICHEVMDVPFIDHNHETGIPRSLLCRKCNTIIAFAHESIEILSSAIQYIKEWKNG